MWNDHPTTLRSLVITKRAQWETVTVMIDGRRASSFGGPPQFAAEGLARLHDDVACCWCGGAAGPAARMTRIARTGTGETAWRQCDQCAAATSLELVGRMLGAHLENLGNVAAIVDLVRRRDVPWFHLTGRALAREERTRPIEAWLYPEADQFARQIEHTARNRGLW